MNGEAEMGDLGRWEGVQNTMGLSFDRAVFQTHQL